MQKLRKKSRFPPKIKCSGVIRVRDTFGQHRYANIDATRVMGFLADVHVNKTYRRRQVPTPPALLLSCSSPSRALTASRSPHRQGEETIGFRSTPDDPYFSPTRLSSEAQTRQLEKCRTPSINILKMFPRKRSATKIKKKSRKKQ